MARPVLLSRTTPPRRRSPAAACLVLAAMASAQQPEPAPKPGDVAPPADAAPAAASPQSAGTVDDVRVAMSKWIETQQVLSKERKDWQQSKEILVSRIDLLKKEVGALETKITQAEAAAAGVEQKKSELVAESERLQAATSRLTEAVVRMEANLRKLLPALPEALQTKIKPLSGRIPAADAVVKTSVAERFQNVLVILGEINKANGEITVEHEVRTLPDGRRAEVQALYVGLGQAYYVGGNNAGIGVPQADGWQWTPAAISSQVVRAVEVLQGKETPAFVPLPVKIQ